MSEKKHRIAISMVQETDGQVDGNTLIEDFSEDGVVHVIKQKVFTEALTTAINEAAQQLANMALDEMTGKTPNTKK